MSLLCYGHLTHTKNTIKLSLTKTVFSFANSVVATFQVRAADSVYHMFSLFQLCLLVILVVIHFDFEDETLVLIASENLGNYQ